VDHVHERPETAPPVAAPETAPSRSAQRVHRSVVVGAADDACEREAEAVAAQIVTRINAGAARGDPVGATDSTRIQRMHTGGAQIDSNGTPSGASEPLAPKVRRMSTGLAPSSDMPVVGAAGGPVDGNIASELSRTAGGRPLDVPVRRTMEHAFGADFRAVRVHTDSAAAGKISAAAFTQGSHIHFAPGAYSPPTRQGQHLLAHELTHTLQQGATRRTFRAAEAPSRPGPESASLFPALHLHRSASIARFWGRNAKSAAAQQQAEADEEDQEVLKLRAMLSRSDEQTSAGFDDQIDPEIAAAFAPAGLKRQGGKRQLLAGVAVEDGPPTLERQGRTSARPKTSSRVIGAGALAGVAVEKGPSALERQGREQQLPAGVAGEEGQPTLSREGAKAAAVGDNSTNGNELAGLGAGGLATVLGARATADAISPGAGDPTTGGLLGLAGLGLGVKALNQGDQMMKEGVAYGDSALVQMGNDKRSGAKDDIASGAAGTMESAAKFLSLGGAVAGPFAAAGALPKLGQGLAGVRKAWVKRGELNSPKAIMLSSRGGDWKETVKNSNTFKAATNALKIIVAGFGIAVGVMMAMTPIGWLSLVAACLAGGYMIMKKGAQVSNARDVGKAKSAAAQQQAEADEEDREVLKLRSMLSKSDDQRSAGFDDETDPEMAAAFAGIGIRPQSDDPTGSDNSSGGTPEVPAGYVAVPLTDLPAERLKAVEEANRLRRQASHNAETAGQMIEGLSKGDEEYIANHIWYSENSPGGFVSLSKSTDKELTEDDRQLYDAFVLVSVLDVELAKARSASGQELIEQRLSKAENM
jgi:hypothetical protein